MASLFVNSVENRPRAFWRLLVQFLVFFGILIAIQVGIGIGAGVLARAAGINPADSAALQAYALDHPLVTILGAIAELIAIWVSYFVASRRMDRRAIVDFGFHLERLWWRDFAFGLALGAFLMGAIFLVEYLVGWVQISGFLQSFHPQYSFGALIFAAFVKFISVGIAEEMLSRGYMLRNLAEGLHGRLLGARGALLAGYLGSSLVFGLLHLGNPNASAISTINLVLAGLFLGAAFILTGELGVPIGLHMTWNFFQGNVFGFPVSGTSSGASFIAIHQGGPNPWTGGAFGPEAGLIGLAAYLLGSALIIFWVWATRGKVQLQEHLAVYSPQTAPGEIQIKPDLETTSVPPESSQPPHE